MWYVFEGGDLTGKTTLVSEFAQLTGFTVFHPIRPSNLGDKISWNVCIDDEMNRMEELAKTGPSNMIMDRTVYISNPVYGPVFGREPRHSLLLRAKTWKIPHAIIYCYADLPTKLARHMKRKEEKYNIGELDHKIAAEYEKLLKRMYCWKVIRLNTSHSSVPECTEAIVTMLDYIGELRCEPTHLAHLHQFLTSQKSLSPISIL